MKIRLSILLLGVVLLLSACGAGPAPAGSGTVSGQDSASSVVSGADSEPPAPSYFGDWEVTAALAAAPACAMSQEEIDACLGLTISYEKDKFTAEGLTCEFLPGTAYAEGVITAEDFAAACQVELSELGVSASMLLHVTADIQGNIGQNRLLGRDFFVLDSDSLLVYCDGAFFLAERTSK